MDDLTGCQVRGYEIQERIGVGGFGVVYRALQSTVGREVAVKVISPRFANEPEFIQRFEMEAQLVARLEHLHIVPLYDYWRDAEGAFLVMRYLRGGSLRGALANGPYDLKSASHLLDQIGAALALAHRNNVIHRDLKPDNILLDEDGNAYIADFGIAKSINANSPITQPGMMVGSMDYLAPEQARSDPVTPQTDIYSLGIIIYEMLMGRHPYPDVTPVDRLTKHLLEPVPHITSLDPSVAGAVNAVIQQATAKNPTLRFSDALALATSFREAAGLVWQRINDRVINTLTPPKHPSGATIADLEHQLAQAEAAGHKSLMPDLLADLAARYFDLGQFPKLVECYTSAIAISRELGDRDGEMRWLTYLANFYAGHHESYKARHMYEAALAISQATGDVLSEGQLLLNLGLTYADLERMADARKFINDAIRVFEQSDEDELAAQAREYLDSLG